MNNLKNLFVKNPSPDKKDTDGKAMRNQNKLKGVQVHVGQFYLRIGDEEILNINQLKKRNQQFEELYKAEIKAREVESNGDNTILSFGTVHLVSKDIKKFFCVYNPEPEGVYQDGSKKGKYKVKTCKDADEALKEGAQSMVYSEENMQQQYREELAHLKKYHYEVLQRIHQKEEMVEREKYKEYVKHELAKTKMQIKSTKDKMSQAEKKHKALTKEYERHTRELLDLEKEFLTAVENTKHNHTAMLSKMEEDHANYFIKEKEAHDKLKHTAHNLTQQIKESHTKLLKKKMDKRKELDKERLELLDQLVGLKQTNALQVREIMAASHLFHLTNESRASEGQPQLDLTQEIRALVGDEYKGNPTGYFHAYSPEMEDNKKVQGTPGGSDEACVIC